jgi:acyl carrier protein
MASREEVELELRRMIASRLPSRPDPATLAADVPIFQKGLGLDSMSGIELLTEIESRFDLYIDDDDFDIFDNLGSMIDFVWKKSGDGT